MAVRFTRASSQFWGITSGAVLDFNADYTLMAWVYLTTDVNGYYSFFGIYGSADYRCDVLQTTNQGDVLNLYCSNIEGTTYIADVNGSTLPIGKWLHLALSRERNSLSDSIVRVYLNGAQNIASVHNLTSRTISSRMYVGAWDGSSDYANGRVAQIKAFQHVLTPDQICAEMESAEPINRRSLFGWWPVWERGAGARNRDWSGNGYNWTETATPTDEDDPPINLSQFLLPAISDGAAAPTSVSGTESGTLSESAALAADVPGSDAGTWGEAASIAATLAGSDSGTLTEVSDLSTAEQFAGTESGTFDESASLAVAIAASDSGVVTDAGALAAAVAGSESGTFDEASSLDTVTQISGTESGTFDESASLAVAIAASDSGTFSETGETSSYSSNHQISVGDGYADVTPRQMVRTSGNRLYISGWKFDTFPTGGIGGSPYNSQTLRMYRADQTGVPATFTRLDSTHEPAGVVSWAMAIDGNDVIHVIWTVRASWGSPADTGVDNYLRYAQFDTAAGVWGTVEDIETSLAIYEVGQGDELVSIAIDESSVPHILYLKSDGTRRRVTYRNRSGGSWSAATTVDDQSFSAGQCCWHPGIVFDYAHRIVVTWMRGDDLATSWTTTTGRLFVRVNTAGSWGTTHDVVGANVWTGIDNGAPLYVDPNGRYHLCYIDTSKQVQYRFSDDQGATWTANHPSSGTYAADNPAPGPGPDGTVRIYSHGSSLPPNVVYWQAAGGSAAWGSPTNYIVPTGYDCSVNVRWSRYWWNHPSTRDIAYWKSDYPTNALYIGTDVDATDLYGVDSGTFAESSALAIVINGSEDGTESEASSLAAALAANDEAAGSESSSLAVALPGTDSGALNEAAEIAAVIAASDSGTFVESSELISGALISGVDSGTFTEVSSLVVVVSATEACTFDDASTIAAALAGSDSGTFDEASDLASGMVLEGSDSGTFTESSSLAVAIAATDACTFSEAVSIAAVLSASDSGLFGELSDLASGRGYVVVTDAPLYRAEVSDAQLYYAVVSDG